jgi:hypothetical protein
MNASASRSKISGPKSARSLSPAPLASKKLVHRRSEVLDQP